MTASYKHENSFTFTPIFKLWFAVNHKPVIRGTDGGYGAAALIPFLVRYEIDQNKRKAGEREADPKLQSKLLDELPGILNWALEGFRLWNDKGLRPPQSVRAATEEYREESDLLGAFIAENLEQRKRLKDEPEGENATKIYKAYCSWCEENGQRATSQRRFGDAMVERGYEKRKETTVIYPGLFFVARPDSPDNPDSSF